MNTKAYKTLYKSVGLPEWRLIVGQQRKKFHPRLLTKPVFYPSLTYDYACKLARDWNAIDHLSEFTGIVVGFNVPPDFLDKYDKLIDMECDTKDLWVTVAELYTLNQVIEGRITVYEIYFGEGYEGEKFSPQELNDEAFLI